MTITFETGEIAFPNGSRATYVAKLNKGYSHIIVDDNCWVIVNGEDGQAGNSAWIFEEALDALKQLPSNPADYAPYREFKEMTPLTKISGMDYQGHRIAVRMLNPQPESILHIIAGDEEWEPTDEEMTHLTELFLEATEPMRPISVITTVPIEVMQESPENIKDSIEMLYGLLDGEDRKALLEKLDT